MSGRRLLKTFVEDYHLEIDGVKFWTPYWRDELPTVDDPQPVTGPYKGKGTPPQLLRNLEGYLKTSSQRQPRTPQAYRQLMHQLHLGIDCSALAFYVLELWLAERDIELADHIFKPRADLLADFANPVYNHPPHITKELIESWPEQVPLSTIKENWGNEPVRLAGVNYLTSEAATAAVERVADVAPGDLVAMTGNDGIPHCVVIINKAGDEVRFAHSGRTAPDSIGGVEYGRITITDPRKGLEDQQWHDDFLQTRHPNPRPVRRLKVLMRGSHHPYT